MIYSMTGYGSAEEVEAEVCYAVEIRSLNNRYLKLALRLPEPFQFVESDVEKLIRSRIGRGSVSYTLRARAGNAAGGASLNVAVMQEYVRQICGVKLPQGVAATIDLATLATLPGVCEPSELDEAARTRHLAAIERATTRALDGLIEMRRLEGSAIHGALLDCRTTILSHLEAVERIAPKVVEEYHEKLKNRVSLLLKAGGIELELDGLLREVAIYADRCDIAEEIARLRSHLEQFAQLCDAGEQVGRQLDFLTQELLRETNTIGSKSNDAVIARHTLEMKTLVDRLREQVQNVE